jgi:hypothetical protein
MLFNFAGVNNSAEFYFLFDYNKNFLNITSA